MPKITRRAAHDRRCHQERTNQRGGKARGAASTLNRCGWWHRGPSPVGLVHPRAAERRGGGGAHHPAPHGGGPRAYNLGDDGEQALDAVRRRRDALWAAVALLIATPKDNHGCPAC